MEFVLDMNTNEYDSVIPFKLNWGTVGGTFKLDQIS